MEFCQQFGSGHADSCEAQAAAASAAAAAACTQ